MEFGRDGGGNFYFQKNFSGAVGLSAVRGTLPPSLTQSNT
jgi:hypothetical protein